MAATTRKAQTQEVDTFGVVLVRGSTYTYKGVRFRRNLPAEVDRATRDHLVASKAFKDTGIEEQEPVPIPVRRKGGVRVRRRATEPGMLNASGGATATGGAVDSDGIEGEPVVEV